jgi:hypothetical protein
MIKQGRTIYTKLIAAKINLLASILGQTTTLKKRITVYKLVQYHTKSKKQNESQTKPEFAQYNQISPFYLNQTHHNTLLKKLTNLYTGLPLHLLIF